MPRILRLAGLVILVLSFSATAADKHETSKIVEVPLPEIVVPTEIPPPIPQEFYRSTYKVRVSGKKLNGQPFMGTGSAVGADLVQFGIDGKGNLITAAHVILNEKQFCDKVEVEVLYEKYKSRVWVVGRIIAYDDSIDIAIIQVDVDLPYISPIASSDQVVRGDVLVAVGCPSGTAVTASVGNLSSKDKASSIQSGFWWQASMPIYYGNSGGAIWDWRRREVVGIAVAGVGAHGLAPNVTFMVSHKAMTDFLKSGKVQKALKDGRMDPPAQKKTDKSEEKRETPFPVPGFPFRGSE